MGKITFNILIAGDDHAISLIVSAELRRQGHTVEIAGNGKEAIELFILKPDYFNVLITDHDMPFVSGLEVVNHLCNSEIQLKIIVVSNSLTMELVSAYRNKRVDNILQKPFTLENLSSTLNGILENWRHMAHA